MPGKTLKAQLEAIDEAEESFAGVLDTEDVTRGSVSATDTPASDDIVSVNTVRLGPSHEPFVLTDRDVQDEIERVSRIWEETNPPQVIEIPVAEVKPVTTAPGRSAIERRRDRYR